MEEAKGVVILLHGRGATAEDILGIADAMEAPSLAYLAPQAAGYQWYPNSFLADRESNEPYLTSALKKVESVVEIALAAGFTSRAYPDRRLLAGSVSFDRVCRHPPRAVRRDDRLDGWPYRPAGQRCFAHRRPRKNACPAA